MHLERIALTAVRAQVYWDNGCQIVAPHDKGIAKCIEENLQPWDVDVDALLKQVRRCPNTATTLFMPYHRLTLFTLTNFII